MIIEYLKCKLCCHKQCNPKNKTPAQSHITIERTFSRMVLPLLLLMLFAAEAYAFSRGSCICQRRTATEALRFGAVLAVGVVLMVSKPAEAAPLTGEENTGCIDHPSLWLLRPNGASGIVRTDLLQETGDCGVYSDLSYDVSFET
jgi:hypothetical protein